MVTKAIALRPAANDFCAPRIGSSKLIRMAYQSADLSAVWNELMASVAAETAGPGVAMDLSLLAQLLGDTDKGLLIQADVLDQQRIYWTGPKSDKPVLRILAFAAALDLGGNTPVDFLIDLYDVELYTVYALPGMPLPNPLPVHDLAIVTVPDSLETRQVLAELGTALADWSVPVLNRPDHIKGLDRDRLFSLLDHIPGVEIPATRKIDRRIMAGLGLEDAVELLGGGFPIIARPVGSHAGKGLARLDAPSSIGAYLEARPESEFFLSRYVDYSGDDGQFRKYRIVFVDRKPYACHMAISDQWKIWYLNANMTGDHAKRHEEEQFMVDFDHDFAHRHQRALDGIARRLDLDYFQIDCAETKNGRLLIFEADISMVVHDMDPPSIFPYKVPQMRKVFGAFVDMLQCHSLAYRASSRTAS